MKFSHVIRWFFFAALCFLSWAILLDRWVWLKIPTQISGAAVYATLMVNVGVMGLLALRPSALGLSTKTGKN